MTHNMGGGRIGPGIPMGPGRPGNPMRPGKPTGPGRAIGATGRPIKKIPVIHFASSQQQTKVFTG